VEPHLPVDRRRRLRQHASRVGDPLLYRYTPDGDCSDDVLRHRATGALVDTAAPSSPADPDGSPADIGAWGGPTVDASWWIDTDQDSWVALFDCEDRLPLVNPLGAEFCNGLDGDCDGIVDGPQAAGAQTVYLDADGDGYGDDATEQLLCEPPSDTTTLGGDCDDTTTTISPGVDERCNGIDDDCDGTIDGSNAIDPYSWFRDEDGDGYGDPNARASACDAPAGFIAIAGDCDDKDPETSPDAVEVCNGRDDDCDAAEDEGEAIGAPTWYLDADGDGFGSDAEPSRLSCFQLDGHTLLSHDCDDANAAVHPQAVESCEAGAPDLNCDGLSGSTDGDGDGFPACEDCDDTVATTYPGAVDTPYDGLIEDCDATTDFDADGDGFISTDWYGDDCDDTDPETYPGANERAKDGIDRNCDGQITDEGGCGGCSASGHPPLTWLAFLAPLVWVRRRP